jgi:hypothetical protein
MNEGRKVILPVWHRLMKDDVARYSPMLAGVLAANTDRGVTHVADEVIRALDAGKKEPREVPKKEPREVPGTATPAVPRLSPDAWDLLIAATQDAHGSVLRTRTQGTVIQAGNRQFVHQSSPREEARWEAALDELVQERLVKDRGYRVRCSV